MRVIMSVFGVKILVLIMICSGGSPVEVGWSSAPKFIESSTPRKADADSTDEEDRFKVYPFIDGDFDLEWSEEAVGQRRAFSDWFYRGKPSARARKRSARMRTKELTQIFRGAQVQWPPAEIYLRAFKAEGELELWAASHVGEEMKPVMTWKLCALSGEFGPKRREGDGQVPEGFYALNYYNPYSSYHLSMRVNYPNRSDRILGDPESPGSDIMIHGKCASIGCLAMTDQRIEELWVIIEATRGVWPRRVSRRKRQIPISIFPSRHLDSLLGDLKYTQHHKLWRALQIGDLYFKQSRRPPQVKVNDQGGYELISRLQRK